MKRKVLRRGEGHIDEEAGTNGISCAANSTTADTA